MADIVIKEERDSQGEDGHVTTKMCLQAREHQVLLANTRSQKRQGRIPFCSFQIEHGPANTLIFDFWPSEM